MDQLLLAALLGGLGGLARSTVGLMKSLAQKKGILWSYFALTTGIAVIIGTAAGTIFTFNPAVAVLSGYAGTDILEGIYKSFKTQKTIITTAK